MTKNTSIKLTAAQQAAMGYLAAIPGAGEYAVAPHWKWATQSVVKALVTKGMIEPRKVERWSTRLECRITRWPAAIWSVCSWSPVKMCFLYVYVYFHTNINID
jgi:hypothetical protein